MIAIADALAGARDSHPVRNLYDADPKAALVCACRYYGVPC